MSKAKLRKWRRSPRGRPTAQGQQFETRRRRSHRRPAPAESTTAWHAWSLDGRRRWPRSRRETPYSPRLAFATRRPFRTTRGGARGLILCVNRRPPRAVARLTVSCRQRVSQPRPRRPSCIFCMRSIAARCRRGVFLADLLVTAAPEVMLAGSVAASRFLRRIDRGASKGSGAAQPEQCVRKIVLAEFVW